MSVTLVPRMSEKAYAQTVSSNTYIFVVPMDSNSQLIKSEVEKQFKGTKVKDVRTVIAKGKAKRTFTKHKRMDGKKADFKKAYITLSEGKINIFGEEDKKKSKQGKKANVNKPVKAETKQKGKIRSVLGRRSRTVQKKGGDK